MQKPTTLTFRKLPRSQLVEQLAEQLAERLRHRYERIRSCHFIIDRELAERAHEAVFHVKLHVTAPTAEIHADSDRPRGAMHRNVQEAMRAACANAHQQLEQLEGGGRRATVTVIGTPRP